MQLSLVRLLLVATGAHHHRARAATESTFSPTRSPAPTTTLSPQPQQALSQQYAQLMFYRKRQSPPPPPQKPESHSYVSTSLSSLAFLRGGATNSGAKVGAGGSLVHFLSQLADSIGQSKQKSWICLILAILCENVAVTMTKWARDTSSPSKMIVALIIYSVSVLGFAASLGKIDVSVAYAVWAAMGTSIVSLAGMTLFGERCDPLKLICLSLVILGVVGLNLQDGH